MDIPGRGTPPIEQVITQMLGHLEGEAPGHRARLLTVRERPVGLANWRGVEVFGSVVPVALKGGRLEAGVQFEVTGGEPQDVEDAAVALHGSLLGRRDGLRSAGFLKIDGPDLSLPAEDEPDAWHKTLTYTVLYEYQYRDVDAAASFITRIPAHADPEEPGSPDRETSLLTGRVVRWQREEEAAGVPPPPPLVVRGASVVDGLTVVAFLPDVPAAGVQLLRTHDGAAGPPKEASGLQELADADHVLLTYASVTGFLADFPLATDRVELSDLDDQPAAYELRTFTFEPRLRLPRSEDRLVITTSADDWSASEAVLYLRAEGT